jgi:hypothetical protein
VAYSAPITRSTGFLVTAAEWNQEVVDNAIFLANPPACRVYNSAHFAVANATDVPITFDTERFDTDTIHSTSVNTNRLTCKTAGLYLIGGSVQWALANGGNREIALRVNGTTEIDRDLGQIDAAPAVALAQNLATIYKLAVNDYVELIAWQNSSVSINAVLAANSSPEFWMTWIGLG